MAVPAPEKIKCPYCGYALLGLPVVHACPECGVEYDPHSVVIRLKGRSRAAGNAINGLMLLVILCLPALLGDMAPGQKARGGQRFRDSIPCVVVLGVITLVGLYRWTSYAGRDRHLIISHAGIRFQHPELPSETIPWSRFGRARAGYIGDGFKIHGRDGRVVFKCRLSQFGSILQARYCVNQMNRLAEVYATQADSAPAENSAKGLP